MPNVIINEYDLSTTGIPVYANFSVVVPGFVADGKGKYDDDTSVFDENGVYECKTQADFEAYIGKFTKAYGAAAPTLYTDDTWPTAQTELSSAALIEKAQDAFEKGTLYIATKSTDPTIGYLHDGSYVYTKATEKPTEQESISELYSIIEATKEGTNGSNHYGNQIAYELLGLGYTVLYKKLTDISELTDATSADAFFAPLKDKSIYSFRYVLTGLLSDNINANNAISKLATYTNNAAYTESGRGDIIALLDVAKNSYTSGATATTIISNINSFVNSCSDSDKFSAFFAPYVSLNIVDTDYNNTVLPGSFYYLACAANAFGNLGYNEWWPVAGYERGVSKYTLLGTGYTFGELAADVLQPRHAPDSEQSGAKKAVNLIIKSHGNYYLYGNRTAHALEDELLFSDFLNIRQLLATLKKQTYYASKKFTFDPNSSLLWLKFCDAIEPVLKSMKADEGIEDYKFVKINTKVKATMKGLIRIVPIEGVEDFKIGVNLEDSIKGVAVNIDELE